MAGYAASARLQGAAPQFAFMGGHVPGTTTAAEPFAGEVRGVVDQFELVGRPIDETIADWLASIGESWSQLTFFLFDSESWR